VRDGYAKSNEGVGLHVAGSLCGHAHEAVHSALLRKRFREVLILDERTGKKKEIFEEREI
jgi:hypothetical protein